MQIMETEGNPSTPNHPEKIASFSRNESNNKKNQSLVPESPTTKDADNDPQINQEAKEITNPEEKKPTDEPELSRPQILNEVNQFIQNESMGDEIPKPVELLSISVESMIHKYGRESSKLVQNLEEDNLFFDTVACLSRVIEKMQGIIQNGNSKPSSSAAIACLDRTSIVLQQAMAFLEDGLRNILESSNSKTNDETLHQKSFNKSPKHSISFNSSTNSNQEFDRCILPGATQTEKEEFPGFTSENISCMNRIVNSMISAGYETECSMVYSILRRNAFRDALNRLGYEVLSIEEVQRMQWESVEGEIASWNNIVKQTSSTLLPQEEKLCNSVFAHQPDISQALFTDLAKAVCEQFLSFAEAMVLTKRSAEKLFKFLDMYEALRDLVGSISYDGESSHYWGELKAEVVAVKRRIGEAAVSIFCDLENSIKSDNSRTPVPSGAVHPLTRYTMNYLKYACEYKETLEEVFQQHHHRKEESSQVEREHNHNHYNESNGHNSHEGAQSSPFSAQLVSVMDLLDANLDMKSKLYRDPSLRYIFLMNNGRYIVQKIKGSIEIHQLMGDTWCRKRSSDLRQYHKNYQRETWYKLLQCLNPEGLQVNGKVVKTVLKERFKSFNVMFDEIHKTQSTWVVSDEQLQSELRVSISAVVTPAYRSFMGRYHQYLDPGRQSEKYVKYQPEDIENLIDELFDGNPTSMARRRT